ncbi:N-acetylmuramoyl-L-alanine amidase [Paenibacillus sp. yr247]|nr:N-acetylmuramoyl-L-alanine amidase [Paenibacillus sp. yr247]
MAFISVALLMGCLLIAVGYYSLNIFVPQGVASTEALAVGTHMAANASIEEGAKPEESPAAAKDVLPAAVNSEQATSTAIMQTILAESPAAKQQLLKPTSEPVASTAKPSTGRLVMLDPGHQRYGNNAPEPVGPETRETKPKVSSGTVGVRTKKPEYVLNLEVSLLIKAELVSRGIEVAMTRESNEVDISNKQRADMANEAGAALAVRIHADGDSSPKTKGFSVLYPSASFAAVKPIAAESHQAAGFILEHLKRATNTAGRGLSARSDLSGFNWSKVPVVLVELGFMTNPEEDELMSEAEYQKKLAVGIADGIEQFLKSR